MKFTKMHGLGNDYIYINGFEEKIEHPKQLARQISPRHIGVGSDGLVLILPSEKADFRMRMFNLDGSEAQMCGNAIRCVGKYVYDRQMTDKRDLTIETLAGVKRLTLLLANGKVDRVRVDMGQPILESRQIPVLVTGSSPVIDQAVTALDRTFDLTCVSMGNPHAVTYVEQVDDYPVTTIGPELEISSIFPEKANIEFVQVVNRQHLKMRVWERGSGETLACGTGACASAVASCLKGLTERQLKIELLGGSLEIEWDKQTNHVIMTGSASFVYEGELLMPIIENNN